MTDKTNLYPSTHEEERDRELENENAIMQNDYTNCYDNPLGY